MTENLSLWTRLAAEKSGLKIWYEAATSSTNDIAKNTPGFDLYLTDHQTAGHGRGVHRWLDEGRGGHLLSSWVFSLASPPQHITGPLAGLAVYRALHATWPELPWSLKAPNDIYLNEKKAGGILLEAVSQGASHRLIVGLGLNVESHPAAIANSICIKELSKKAVTATEWENFIAALIQNLRIAVARCQRSHLSQDDRDQLLSALNSNPNLSHPFDRIDHQGNLYDGEQQTPWQNILE